MGERMKNIGLAAIVLGAGATAVYEGREVFVNLPAQRDAVVDKIPVCSDVSFLGYDFLQQELDRELDLRRKDSPLVYMKALVDIAKNAQFITCGVEAKKAVEEAGLGSNSWRMNLSLAGFFGGTLGFFTSGYSLLRRFERTFLTVKQAS